VLIVSFPAGPWGTNCYVVAPAPGEECVIVDPGMDSTDGVAEVVRQHRLRPAAVLVTHGHIDHMFCVAPVAGAYDATAYVHPDDRALLTDPFAGLSPETAGMLGGDYTFAEPDDVRELADGQRIGVAGLIVDVDHAPGHTWGSVAFRTPYDGPEDTPELMFSGDLLFAGSIGRTDLPGGDHPTMLRSLATKVLPLDDAIVVLPGHGAQTTIGRERAANPFLRGL
jgi:hydroxyacylglutathione hydrolase